MQIYGSHIQTRLHTSYYFQGGNILLEQRDKLGVILGN
jgi:hypothetical protein